MPNSLMCTVAADTIFIFPYVYLGGKIINIFYIDFHDTDDSDRDAK